MIFQHFRVAHKGGRKEPLFPMTLGGLRARLAGAVCLVVRRTSRHHTQKCWLLDVTARVCRASVKEIRLHLGESDTLLGCDYQVGGPTKPCEGKRCSCRGKGLWHGGGVGKPGWRWPSSVGSHRADGGGETREKYGLNGCWHVGLRASNRGRRRQPWGW